MFFLSLFLILFLGTLISILFKKIRIPALIGYLVVGICLKYFGLLDNSILNISSEIRKIALLIILIKAGLNLNISDLKKVGRPAIFLAFLPAVIEMTTIGLVAPHIFNITYVESFLLGAVIGAVSPAVVVPRMTHFMDESRGTKKGIPQMVVAGSSVDDIIMIVFFTAFLGIEGGSGVTALTFLNIPLSIVLGIVVGILIGILLSLFFKYIKCNIVIKLISILAIAFLLTYVESALPFGYSSLLSTIVIGITILTRNKEEAKELSKGFNSLWIVGEMFLFILLGASVELDYLFKYLGLAIILILIGLAMRMVGVFISLIKTPLNVKERLFVGISYLPKATVQAAIGGELLALGNSLSSPQIISAGVIVLSVSVVAIIFTAPLTALTIDLSYKYFLTDDKEK